MTWFLTLVVASLAKVGSFVAIIIGLIIGSHYYFQTKYYHQGWSAAMHAIALKNDQAVKDADDAKKEVDACLDSRGDWDITTGECLRKQ